MAVYTNFAKNSTLKAVEFTPVSDGNFSFFYLASSDSAAGAKQWLASLGQDVITETNVDGKPVLITQGIKTQSELMKDLHAHGERLQFHHKARNFSEIAWPLRSALGMTGQCLQVSGSLMRGKHDWGLFTFAVANLAANSINLLFGSQKSEDVHRLRFLKSEVNDRLSDYVRPGDKLPRVDDTRMTMRVDENEDKTHFKSANTFLKRYSVSVGELGLRYLGAFSLAFPTNHWNSARKHMREGNISEAYRSARDSSDYRHYAALGSISGKTVALFSKSEDPYDPKPRDPIDTIRQKVTFRAGGWIETASFATLAMDEFSKAAKNKGRDHASFVVSGMGAVLFTLAYITRNWAKFGEKETDMNELYAHVSDSLVKMPPEKIPALMAETAAFIKENFKDKQLDFGSIFTQLTTDLYRYHRVSIQHPITTRQKEATAAIQEAPVFLEQALQRGQNGERTLQDRVFKPAATRVESLAKAGAAPEQAMRS